jgi:alkylation response protein AidB-like acyl-CoA dehydrogenase
MSSLILSRRDVDFLLHEWLQVEQLTRHNRYAEHSRQTFDAALDTYETLASSEFAPHNKKNDQLEPHFDGDSVRVNSEIRAALHAFASAGLIAAAQSPEYGGTQLPHVVERAGMAFIMAANISTASYAILTAANASLLLAHGTRQQTGRYVLPMLDGRFSGTMCLSEPQAGSSLADITTRAEKEADGQYRLFGNKMWISAGDHDATDNIVHLVLAKIPDANGDLIPGVGGISLFVVPKLLVGDDGGLGVRNDVVVAGLNHKMGQRGTSNCLLNFGEGKFQPAGRSGAVGEIVGQEGKGLAYMFHMMNEARIAVGLGAVALGYTGYLHALEYARIRRQGRPAADRNPTHPQIPLIQHADVRRMLLTQKA